MPFTLLLLLFIPEAILANIFLQSVEGEVVKDNFTYWTLNYNGTIIMMLNSTTGDADLYISEQTPYPTFDPDTYDLHSATCGLDVIEVPKNLKRPIGVGVFGHYTHDKSRYVLEIFLNTEKIEVDADYDDLHAARYLERDMVEDRSENKFKSKLKSVIMKTGVWALLELLEMVLF